jgi:ankyrin repeat protein
MPPIRKPVAEDPDLMRLIRAIINGDEAEASKLLSGAPTLARQSLVIGASRGGSPDLFFPEIMHHLYTGDTPLHVAAAGYRTSIARDLLKSGASAIAKNRRGAEPLHYASDGGPNPKGQAETIALLIEAGANPNSLDRSGVGPLHRAVRKRRSAAVAALLNRGAEVGLRNKSGSTPLHLAVQNTGSSGSGSDEAKAGQKEIVEILMKAGASPKDRDGKGKSVIESVGSDRIRELLESF